MELIEEQENDEFIQTVRWNLLAKYKVCLFEELAIDILGPFPPRPHGKYSCHSRPFHGTSSNRSDAETTAKKIAKAFVEHRLFMHGHLYP